MAAEKNGAAAGAAHRGDVGAHGTFAGKFRNHRRSKWRQGDDGHQGEHPTVMNARPLQHAQASLSLWTVECLRIFHAGDRRDQVVPLSGPDRHVRIRQRPVPLPLLPRPRLASSHLALFSNFSWPLAQVAAHTTSASLSRRCVQACCSARCRVCLAVSALSANCSSVCALRWCS